MTRRVLAALLASVAACSGGAEEPAGIAPTTTDGGSPDVVPGGTVDGTVDCIAMMAGANEKALSTLTWAYTWAPLAGDGESHLGKYYGDTTPKRCTVVFRGGDQFRAGGKLKVHKAEDFDFVSTTKFPANAMAIAINYGGKEYVASEGTISLDAYEDGKASGTYDAYFQLDGGATGHLKGKLDFCSYGFRRDCPYNVEGALAQKVTVSSMSVSGADAEPGACRVLVDRASGGVQVDVDIAIWRKMSVTQLFTAGCDPGNQNGLNANRLTFRTGGWKGPGTYGPFKSVKFRDADPQAGAPELWLPSLSWKSPASFCDLISFKDPGSYCLWQNELLANGFDYSGYTTDASQCTYTITDSPGHVDLSCTKVWHYTRYFSDATTRLASGDLPPLTLSADCDVVYKN